MAVLAIDVGLRNLAVCCMDADKTLVAWELIDTLEESATPHACCGAFKDGRPCSRPGKLQLAADADKFACAVHAKQFAVKKAKARPKIKATTLQTLAQATLRALDAFVERYPDLLKDRVKKIVIELQPKVNNKMKFTSHVIFGKLVEELMRVGREKDVCVRFVAARKKLRECDKSSKNTYAKRKKLAIEQASAWLCDHERESCWVQMFESTKKKDDLSDCLLMALDALS